MVVRGRTKVTRKGQITIPAEVRRALNLREGEALEVSFDEAKGSVSVSRPDSVVAKTAGILRRFIQDDLDADTRLALAEKYAEQDAIAEAIARDERSRAG